MPLFNLHSEYVCIFDKIIFTWLWIECHRNKMLKCWEIGFGRKWLCVPCLDNLRMQRFFSKIAHFKNCTINRKIHAFICYLLRWETWEKLWEFFHPNLPELVIQNHLWSSNSLVALLLKNRIECNEITINVFVRGDQSAKPFNTICFTSLFFVRCMGHRILDTRISYLHFVSTSIIVEK